VDKATAKFPFPAIGCKNLTAAFDGMGPSSDGSARPLGESARVNAQLIDAASGHHH
jgi:hypothetical protein